MARGKQAKYKKGVFNPQQPEKVINKGAIIYRSYLEWKWMHILDGNSKVKYWGSENFTIPYIKPTDGKAHRYYPDFFVEFMDGGKHVIEIKPAKEIKLIEEYLKTGITPKTIQKKRPNEKVSTFKYRQITWAINCAKWKACQEYCDNKGWKFLKMSEKDFKGTDS